MFLAKIPRSIPDEFARCEERKRIPDYEKITSSSQKADLTIKERIYNELWADVALKALDHNEIDIHVTNGIVSLNGHLTSSNSQSRINNAIRTIPGVVEIKNNLIPDDMLSLEVASSLGDLERTYGCKFLTGVSHGAVSLNGVVSDENVKLLAEKCVAANPNVRAVINNVRIPEVMNSGQDQPFRQPAIGENIYFLDGIYGVLKQVIINPDNRRVIAMIVQGKFTDQRQDLKNLNDYKILPPERLIVIHISAVRYLTKVSGFLNICSYEKDRYLDFNAGYFAAPDKDWTPPYPYCSEDVLFSLGRRITDIQIEKGILSYSLPIIPEEASPDEQLILNDSPGG